MSGKAADPLAGALAELALGDFTPHYDLLAARFPDSPRWREVRAAGSELWLDSGDIEVIGKLWTRQFSAVTTNNTLLNKEVQKGQYDQLIKRAAAMIRGRAGRKVDDRELALEIAFVLNARHALRLVEAFDAFVSVEEHTDLAHDADAAVRFARRYYAICPQRFFVKIPLTPAGLIAARRCHEESIPVNLTLGFSARQNYLAARFARPRFVNVFLGRLNQVVAENGLGDGRLVGEKATLASQRAVTAAANSHKLPTRQIAASIRSAEQLGALAGVDVLTIPTAAAEEFAKTSDSPGDKIASRVEQDYPVQIKDSPDVPTAAVAKLWDVPDVLADACDELDRMNVNDLTPQGLIKVLASHKLGDLLVNWPAEQAQLAQRQGKVPVLRTWREGLAGGQFGLDALMNLAGLTSFAADQSAMDGRIHEVLSRG